MRRAGGVVRRASSAVFPPAQRGSQRRGHPVSCRGFYDGPICMRRERTDTKQQPQTELRGALWGRRAPWQEPALQEFEAD